MKAGKTRLALPLAAALAVLPAVASGSPGAKPKPRGAGLPLVVAQVPLSGLPSAALAGGTLRGTLGEGGRLVGVAPDGRARVLTAGFDSAADPEVSFDGERILFAARKQKSDPWCVYEMKADGSDARPITCGAAGARQPVYQSAIYTITPTNVEPWIQVAFVGTNPGERNEAGVAANTSLWSCKTDGSALRRLSFNLSNDMDPAILPDGRMVYASWLRPAAAPSGQGRVSLLGLNEDGTDLQLYAGSQGLRVKQTPTPTAGGLVVFVEADEIAGDGSGRLAALRQSRPLHSHRPLSGAADGLYRAPSGLPDGRLLVAWRPGPAAAYGIVRFDPETGRREPLFDDPAWHDVQAKLLAPRAVPDARSSVVRDDDAEGKLFAVDVNIHDLGPDLAPGQAKALRVVEGVPASDSRPAGRRLLGTIPLAADGSFQVQVPANTPVQLQILDSDGLALRSSAWLWVRNHAAQGCVGCHEDPERTPPNRFAQALAAPAPVLNQPPDRRRSVGFAADLQPIVEAKCLACHGKSGDAPALDKAAESVLRSVVPGHARRSRLVWHLLGRNTARPWDEEAKAPAPRPLPAAHQPSAEEVRAFVEWIDLGGQP